MTEQIFINGTRMDMQEDSGVSLIFQSPYFTDLDNIVSNRTTTVTLPATRNNLLAIDRADLASQKTSYEFRRHSVVYRLDGIQIFSGVATLHSITPTAIKFSFVWGNVAVFEKLLDTNLRDLQTEADYVGYDDQTADTDKRHYPEGWDKRENWGGSAALSIQPVMPVTDIMARIRARFGVTLTLPTTSADVTDDLSAFGEYHIPLVYREADDRSRMKQGVVLNGSRSATPIAFYGAAEEANCIMRVIPGTQGGGLSGGVISDPNDLYRPAGAIDVSGIETLIVRIPAGFAYRAKAQMTGLTLTPVGSDRFYYEPFGVLRATRTQEGSQYLYTYEQDTEQRFDVSKYDYITLVQDVAFNTNNPAALGTGTATTADIAVFDAGREELTFGPGAVFPLYRNLPDWTVSQFLKNLMKLEGLFAYAESPTAIRFVSIGELYDNRIRAIDWSDKLHLTDNAPTDKSTAFGNYARRNWCRYTEDESVPGNYDAAIIIDNQTLEEETELISVDFAPTSGNVIKVWRYDSDGEEAYDEKNWSFEEVEPRILLDSAKTGTPGVAISFAGLSWERLIAVKYRSYQNLVQRLHVVKATVRLSAPELAGLDMTRPVYARQWGRYYAINKLTAKSNGTADVELLRLGDAVVYPITPYSPGEPSVDPPVGPTNGRYTIRAVANGDGTYRIKAEGLTAEQIQSIVNDPNYHLCLIRYGYTRRGNGGEKFDKKYGWIGTHTSRSMDFRNFRDRNTWRIMGHEILKRGSLSAHSQTAKTAIYKGATLVFELDQTVVLPGMRPKQRDLTRNGRIRNTAADGIMELYVGLYRKITKVTDANYWTNVRWGWELVSNLIQVRGRNAMNTKYWEFEKSNEKGI